MDLESWKETLDVRNKCVLQYLVPSSMHALHEELAGASVGHGSLSSPENKPLFWATDLKAVGLSQTLWQMFVYQNHENCLSIGSSSRFSETSVIQHSFLAVRSTTWFCAIPWHFKIYLPLCLFFVFFRLLFSPHPTQCSPVNHFLFTSPSAAYMVLTVSYLDDFQVSPPQTSALNSI